MDNYDGGSMRTPNDDYKAEIAELKEVIELMAAEISIQSGILNKANIINIFTKIVRERKKAKND